MTFLPIVERELRVTARRRGTYWNRALSALAAILVFGGALIFEAQTPPKELGKAVFNILSVLFLLNSLAAGVFISSMSKNPRKAMFGTLLLILLIHGGLPALGAWITYRYYNGGALSTFLLPSAGYAYSLAFDAGFKSRPGEYLESMLVIHGLGWVLLALASVIVRNSWQDKPAGAGLARWQQRWQQWSYGNPAQRLAFRARLLNLNPCLWLGGRHRLKPALVWSALGLGACVWLWGALRWREDWLNELTYVFTAIILHTTLKFWVASEACLRLGPDHRSGALELLLSSPLTVREILRGQMLALRRQFFWPVLLVAGLDFLFLFTAFNRIGSAGDSQVLWFCLGVIATFAADVYTLCWVGMWTGLIAKHPNRATLATFARVVVLPCGAWSAVMILVSFMQLWSRLNRTDGLSMLLWLGFGVAND